MGEEPEPQLPEQVAQEQHVSLPQQTPAPSQTSVPRAPEQSQAPTPQTPERGYWSVPSDDSDEEGRRTASLAVATAATESSDAYGPEAVPAPRPLRRPTAALGWVALGLAALCVIADVVAVVLAVQRYWVSATLIAEGANVATAVVFVVGLFAAWRRPARWLGIIAMVVAILANPFILGHLLVFLGGSGS